MVHIERWVHLGLQAEDRHRLERENLLRVAAYAYHPFPPPYTDSLSLLDRTFAASGPFQPILSDVVQSLHLRSRPQRHRRISDEMRARERRCAYCRGFIPAEKRADAIYCTPSCNQLAYVARKKESTVTT